MDETRTCSTCGKTYSKPDGWTPRQWKTRRLRCCSLACFRASPTRPKRSAVREKPCKFCGEIFAARRNQTGVAWQKRLYCSIACYHAQLQQDAQARFDHNRECPICKTMFVATTKNQRTCGSDECKQRYWREIRAPALSVKMKADFASGKRTRRLGRSKTELLVWQHLEAAGWAWSLRWRDHWGAFEIDFAVPQQQIAVELDGPAHHRPAELAKDAARDAELAARGWRILRISNAEVDADPLAVIAKITAFAS